MDSTNKILIGLGYNANDALISQVKRVLSACDLDESEISHILNLHQKLKPLHAFIALSNSEDVFKIKCEAQNGDTIREFNDIVNEWAGKYSLRVRKLDGKETFYILGRA